MHMSLSEILVIVVVALLVIKPERLPELFKQLGRSLQWMQKQVTLIKEEWDGKKER